MGIISAAGLMLPGRPAGDVVICAFGYALCGALIFRLVRQRAGLLWASSAILLMLALMPRYYKWYYWLVPIVGLAISAGYLQRDTPPRPRYVTSWGAVAGLALLVRLDLGVHAIAYGFFCLLLFGIYSDRSDQRDLWRSGLRFLAGVAVFPAAYGLLLAVKSGKPLALFDLLYSMTAAAQEVVAYWNRPLPALGAGWLTVDGGTWILYLAVIASYGLAVLVALSILRSGRPEDRLDALLLLAFAVGGIGIFPQALSRRDVQHLLQTLAPFLVTLPLAIRLSWRLARRLPRPAASLLMFAALGSLAALVTGTVLIRPEPGIDLGPLRRNHVEAWDRLTHLPNSIPNHPVTKAVAALREQTAPDERVFVAMHYFSSPVIVFGNRQVAGLQPVYMPGILTTPEWIRRNVELLETEPVRVLIVEPNEWASAPADQLAPYDAPIVTKWRQTYERVLFSGSGFEIRSR